MGMPNQACKNRLRRLRQMHNQKKILHNDDFIHNHFLESIKRMFNKNSEEAKDNDDSTNVYEPTDTEFDMMDEGQ